MEDPHAQALGGPQGDDWGGPLAIREIARRVARDVKAVHADVHLLVNAGLLEKTSDGKIVFPYDEVHVDFVLKAA